MINLIKQVKKQKSIKPDILEFIDFEKNRKCRKN